MGKFLFLHKNNKQSYKDVRQFRAHFGRASSVGGPMG